MTIPSISFKSDLFSLGNNESYRVSSDTTTLPKTPLLLGSADPLGSFGFAGVNMDLDLTSKLKDTAPDSNFGPETSSPFEFTKTDTPLFFAANDLRLPRLSGGPYETGSREFGSGLSKKIIDKIELNYIYYPMGESSSKHEYPISNYKEVHNSNFRFEIDNLPSNQLAQILPNNAAFENSFRVVFDRGFVNTDFKPILVDRSVSPFPVPVDQSALPYGFNKDNMPTEYTLDRVIANIFSVVDEFYDVRSLLTTAPENAKLRALEMTNALTQRNMPIVEGLRGSGGL